MAIFFNDEGKFICKELKNSKNFGIFLKNFQKKIDETFEKILYDFGEMLSEFLKCLQ